jgi:transposase
LQPVWRRVWRKRGERAEAVVEPRYEWLWLYATVHPRTGRVFWLILPFLNGACVQLFLDEFARTHLTEGKRIVLVWDGAPAHRTKKLRVPAGITIINFPAYTPELNPTERLWSPVKEGIANQRQADINQLEEKVILRCQKISEQPEAVKSLTNYHWWSRT